MNQNFYDQDDPLLSREDAIAILNTPDDKLNDLIARAEGLRRKYKGNRVSIHILTNARASLFSTVGFLMLVISARSFVIFPLSIVVSVAFSSLSANTQSSGI